MCIFILGLQVSAAWPLLVAANRDEFYERPAEPPQLLDGMPRILAGRDGRAGGTWLGLNEHGLVVALTNRYLGPDLRPPPLPTSRGHLCLEALRQPRADAAVSVIRATLAAAAYNPFNLIVADSDTAFCLSHTGDIPKVVALDPGWHIVANRRLNDPDDPRVLRARNRLPPLLPDSAAKVFAVLADICRDHGDRGVPGQADCICQHLEASGTRSSSLICRNRSGRWFYRHAEGAPCTAEYTVVPVPWQVTGRANAAGRGHDA